MIRTGCCMQCVFLDLGPDARNGALRWLLLPDQNLPIVRTRGKYVSVSRMCPSDLPDGSCVPSGGNLI